MFCCACNGTCNHTGPHSYCEAHGGRSLWPTYTGTNTRVEPVRWPPCNHCWCIEKPGEVPVDHRTCCKCGDRLHMQFIDGAPNEEREQKEPA